MRTLAESTVLTEIEAARVLREYGMSAKRASERPWTLGALVDAVMADIASS